MSNGSHPTLDTLARELASGQLTSRQIVEACLQRISDPAGEGLRTLSAVDPAAVLAAADAVDRDRARGVNLPRFAGIPVSVKDLFDVSGQVTAAGSLVLADRQPAVANATAVERLRQAGLIVIGRSTMPEFALSSLGINPHYGTPSCHWDRKSRRVPGGSSSGAAVSVTDGMAHAALGTDTGGSCRIPAAFNGLVGFKPTAATVPMDGLVPLSPSLDAIGPIARSVACCASLHEILSGMLIPRFQPKPLAGLKLGVPQTMVMDNLDAVVANAFERSLGYLAAAGAEIITSPFAAFSSVPQINARGGFVAAESFAWHRPWIECKRELYDPRILERIERGAAMTAADYLDLLSGRKGFIDAISAEINQFDAILMPTCAILPPVIDTLADENAYNRANFLALRNAALVNLFDGCSISIPMPSDEGAPCGMMISSSAGQDGTVLQIAAGIEELFNS